MASYHLSVKTVSRAHGRTATAAAAYRSAERIRDERTGERHDYTRKRGVEHREIVLPKEAPPWAGDREKLWNAAEAAERRKNATVAREFEIALPSELTSEQRKNLAIGFARELVARHRIAVDIALHRPHREGDQRNHHAHILCSTRRLTAEGFAEKSRELDDQRSGEITHWRERWTHLQNDYLRALGHDARVDHRTLEEQGVDRQPSRHKGPAITAIERRGAETLVPERWRLEERAAALERLEQAAELGRIERAAQSLQRSILDLSGDLGAAKRDRDSQRTASSADQVRIESVKAWQLGRAAQRQGRDAAHSRSAAESHESLDHDVGESR